MEPNIFRSLDELLKNTTVQVKDIPEKKFLLPPTEDPILGFKPLKPDVIPNEAKPVILDNPTFVKKDIVPFNLAERQAQISADQMNKEKADEILVESRNPELLLAKLKKLEEADLDQKIMKLDTLIKAYELRSLESRGPSKPTAAEVKKDEASRDKTKEDEVNRDEVNRGKEEPDFFELREADLDSDEEEQKYPSRANVPHIDIEKLRRL